MKGDFTRNTFQAQNHFRQVLMQQGRVQLDADWNEQGAIAARRDESAAADVVGPCGGPADGAAFGVVSGVADLAKVPAGVAKWFKPLPLSDRTRIKNAVAAGDFVLTPGRYYVDGIQCELETPVLFSEQPDLPGQTLGAGGTSLLYLDVWLRHLTALEAPSLLETALSGVDTSTRVKTVWQVRALALDDGIPAGGCGAKIAKYQDTIAPSAVRLSAQTEVDVLNDDPCQVPETSGYKGLENQLYRVEIHELNPDGSGKNWKWSRENGSVVARLLAIDMAKKQLSVESLGRDEALGFAPGQWVEILDDTLELKGVPGDLIEIAEADRDRLTLTLLAAPDLSKFPDGLVPARHPKIRRWDGWDTVKQGWLPVEAGIQVRFDDTHARCHSGDFWLMPARAATPNATLGDIEWPRKLDAQGHPDPTQPISLLPRGIHHHYCRLGFYVTHPPAGADKFTDCRCLWPSLSNLPRIFYISGDGQEVMPVDPAHPAEILFKLPQPLIVGVANPHGAPRAMKVRFAVEPPGAAGRVTSAGGTRSGVAAETDVDVGINGLASCDFYLDKAAYSQRVGACLLDAIGNPVSPRIFFNATLSIASQVAYDPRGCAGLDGQRTVQTAIDRLTDQLSLYKVRGDAQTLVPGAALEKVIVRAANRCGAVPLKAGWVSFKVLSGGGRVVEPGFNTDGTAECSWTLGPGPGAQELEAVLEAAAGPAAEPKRVVFTAQRSAGTQAQDKGIHVLEVRLPRKVLPNDTAVRPADLAEGIVVTLDGAVEKLSLEGKPSCFVTVEVPFPLTSTDVAFWDTRQLVGFQPLVLSAELHTNDKQIVWKPAKGVTEWLGRLLDKAQENHALSRVLTRLTLKGNVIWADGDPKTTLDGEAFGQPGIQGRVDLDLGKGSGDGRRGGDFEMWFWLIK